MSERMKGVIRNLVVEKNFGFITGADNRDYFFHASALTNIDYQDLTLQLPVEFEPTDSAKGKRAENVRAV